MLKPSSKPQQDQERTRALLKARGWDPARHPVAILGIRGYYGDTFAPAGNNRGIYDDALIVVSPTAYATFNANTDPSVFRKGIAALHQGKWLYKIGKHKIMSPLGYKALVQAGPVTVERDGKGPDTGYFGINIHRGSNNSTSSLGCQTIVPEQWAGFIGLVEGELKRHGQTVVPYILMAQ